MKQVIHIKGLSLSCQVGVPDEELAIPQKLLLHLELVPEQNWSELDDQIERTVDYAQVVAQVEQLSASRPRRLIETLASDVVDFLLTHHPLEKVRIVIEKFILPQTQAVAVELERHRS